MRSSIIFFVALATFMVSYVHAYGAENKRSVNGIAADRSAGRINMKKRGPVGGSGGRGGSRPGSPGAGGRSPGAAGAAGARAKPASKGGLGLDTVTGLLNVGGLF